MFIHRFGMHLWEVDSSMSSAEFGRSDGRGRNCRLKGR
jgi:hypothetical protein